MTYPFAQVYLQPGTPRDISGTLTYQLSLPSASVTDLMVFAPCPPNTPGQQVSSESLQSGTQVLDVSPLKRPLFEANLAGQQVAGISSASGLTLTARYQITTTPRSLVQGTAPTGNVYANQPNDSAQYLAATTTLNFNTSVFQQWLKQNNLIKRASERDIDFAYRSLVKISNLYFYNFDPNQDRSNSNICQSKSSDCGGLSWLFEGTMRANGVPARSLIGRWLKTDNTPDATSSTDGECHVKAEFYAQGVGWIPVDTSGAVSNKDAYDNFGSITSDYVTFHLDPDLIVNTGTFGQQSLRNLQSPSCWFSGGGGVAGMTSSTTWQAQ